MPKLKEEKKPLSETKEIVCPDCACDYVIPLVKITFTRSFAGNRLNVEWPSRDGVNDTALIACPSCAIIFRIQADGSIQKSDYTWAKKRGK